MKPAITIDIDESGFTLRQDGNDFGRLAWCEVENVEVFKRDLLTTDMICLAFHCENGSVFEVNEDLLGFRELVDAIRQQFPDSEKDWERKIAKPAFATNSKIIYAKKRK